MTKHHELACAASRTSDITISTSMSSIISSQHQQQYVRTPLRREESDFCQREINSKGLTTATMKRAPLGVGTRHMLCQQPRYSRTQPMAGVRSHLGDASKMPFQKC